MVTTGEFLLLREKRINIVRVPRKAVSSEAAEAVLRRKASDVADPELLMENTSSEHQNRTSLYLLTGCRNWDSAWRHMAEG